MGFLVMKYLTTGVRIHGVCKNDYSMDSSRGNKIPTCYWWLYLFGFHGVL